MTRKRWWAGSPADRRIEEEVREHLSRIEEDLLDQGLDAEEARRCALERFGDPAEVVARTRAEPGRSRRDLAWMDSLRQDVRFGLRQFVRDRRSLTLSVLTLVLGVAATAVVYGVVHAVVLAPLPYHEPDRLVDINQTSPQGMLYGMSEPNFVDFRDRQRSFQSVAAMGYGNPVWSSGGTAEAVEGMRVSHDLFDMAGVSPILGRGFVPAEDTYGGSTAVAVLAEGAWKRRFGGDSTVLETVVDLDGVPHVVVGVVASDRTWPGVEVFTPLAPNPDVYRDDQRLKSVGRLLPGTTIEDANRDLAEIAQDLSVLYPESNDGWGASARPLRDWLVGSRLTRLGYVLLGIVGLFLLMACASVSNLLLARATARVDEMAVRSALGASRKRLALQLSVEGALLGIVSLGLALPVAHGALRVVRSLGPADVGRLSEATLSGPVIGMASVAGFATVMVACLAPVIFLFRRTITAGLGRSAAAVAGGARVRSILLIAQYGLALAVLASAGLLARSFVRLQSEELGFEPGGVVRFGVRLPEEQFSPGERGLYLQELAEALRPLPGVQQVGVTSASPYTRFRPSNFVARSDREPDRQQDFLPVSWRAVAGDYFGALRLPVLAGRVFEPQDHTEEAAQAVNPPVVIDETLAHALFGPDQDAVGQLVTWFLPGGPQFRIIGVVGAARDERRDAEPRPRIYRPFSHAGWDQPSVLIRVAGDPARAIPVLRSAVLQVDPSIPAIAPTLMVDDVSEAMAWPRFSAQVLGVFGLLAFALASLGVYGVTAFNVARRHQELGLRMALGAAPPTVRRLVLADTLKLAAAGTLLGLTLSVLGGRLLTAVLYETRALDPLTFGVVPLMLLVVSLLSASLPAARAVAIDPARVLSGD